MTKMVDVEIILDEKCTEPKVTIRTKSRSTQVENILAAIENASDADFPFVTAYKEGKLELVSQRDIVRVRTEGRTIVLDTEDDTYKVRQSLSQLENQLNEERFCRISQSEIVNLYKVKNLDVSVSGTVALEFENGVRTYVARRHIRNVKESIRRIGGGANEPS